MSLSEWQMCLLDAIEIGIESALGEGAGAVIINEHHLAMQSAYHLLG